MVPEGTNEDLVFWFETTEGRMRLFPKDGLWTVETYDNDVTKQPHITVIGLDSFTDALMIAARTLYHPVAALSNERTLKGLAVQGFAIDSLEEYRAKAVANAEGV